MTRLTRFPFAATLATLIVIAGSPAAILSAEVAAAPVAGHGGARADSMRRADEAVRSDRLQEAERIYRSILSHTDGDVEVWLALGRLYLRADEFDDAIAAFEEILSMRDVATAAQLRESRALLDHAHAVRTEEWLAALEAGDADLASAFVFARRLVNTNRYAAGEQLLGILVHESPDDPQVHYWLSQALINLGDHEQGIGHLEHSARLAPDNLHLRLELGSAHEVAGTLDRAEKIYSDLAGQASGDLLAQVRARLAYVQAQRAHAAGAAGAEAALRAALELNPDSIALRLSLSEIHGESGRMDDAIAITEEAARRARTPRQAAEVRARLDALYLRQADRLVNLALRGEAAVSDVVPLARLLLQRGLGEAAIDLLDPVSVTHPDDPRIHFWLGRARIGSGEIEQGVAAIERSVQLSPPNPVLLLELGHAYREAKRLPEAEDAYGEVIAQTGNTALREEARRHALLTGALRAEQDGDPATALARYETLLGEHPDDVGLRFERGRLLLALGRNDESDEAIDALLASAPDDRSMRLRLAQVYMGAGRTARAVRMYEDVLQRDPSDHAVAIDLGRVHLAAGEIDAAFTRFAHVMEEGRRRPDPGLARLLDALAGELLAQGAELAQGEDAAAAEAFLTRLVDLMPQSPQAHYAMSRVYQTLGDHERRADHLARVVDLAPENPMMRRRLALAWIDAGRPAEARTVLVPLLESFPHDSELRLALAAILEERSEPERARAEYARVVDLNPGGEWRRRALDALGLARARALLDGGDGAGAAEIARDMLATTIDPEIYRVMARGYQQAGRYTRAEEAWRELLRLSAEDPDARLGLARLYAATGREDEAGQIYHALATQEPPPAQSATARVELDRLLEGRAQEHLARTRATDGPSDSDRENLLALGIELFDLGGHAGASAIFEYLVSAFPEDPEPHYRLGRVFAARDRPADAIVFLRHGVDMRPEEPRYLEGLALAYRDAGLTGPAIDALEQAVANAPHDAALRLALADLYHQTGAPDLARHQYGQALVRGDRDDVARAIEGLELPADPARIAAGDLPAALVHFRTPGTIVPVAPAARLYLAEILRRLGHLEEAGAMLRSIPADDPAHYEAGLRLAVLEIDAGAEDRAIAALEALSSGSAPPAIRREAGETLDDVLATRADRVATALGTGEPGVDAREARDLGTILVRRGHPDRALALLEAVTDHLPADPQAWYWLGRAHMLSGNTTRAIDLLQRSVALAPENPLLRYELGLALQRSGSLARAESEFRMVPQFTDDAALRRDAMGLAAQVRGRRLALDGQYAAALAEYEHALTRVPGDVGLLSEYARLHMMLERPDKAERSLTRALAIAPDNAGVRLQLAETNRVRGDPGRALVQLAEIVGRSPGTPEAARARSLLGYDRGLALIEAGELEDARVVFERLMNLVPADIEARYQLGRIHFLQRRLAEAAHRLTEVTASDPQHQEAHLLLGRLYEVLDRRDDAIVAYERTLDIDPGSDAGRQALPLLATLYGQRFQAMIEKGRPGEAVALLERLVASAPDNAAARINLARLHLQGDRDDLALRQLREVISIRPDDAAAHRLMGVIHAGRGRHAQAAEAYARAIAADDDPERAQATAVELVLSVARLMAAENRPFATIRHLQALTDPVAGAGRDDERPHSMLGVIYRQQGRLDEASRSFSEAVRLAPDNIAARFNLAEVHERRHYEDLAFIQHREIVRRGEPGDRFVEESRRRAERLRDRLALFSSNLRYAITLGESVLQEQDLDRTGALNSSFNSQLFYNLGTNFRPAQNVNLRLDTGLIYIANHSTRDDMLIRRLGIAGSLRFPAHFYSGSAHVSSVRDFMRDRAGGRTINLNLSGGLRFTDPLALFRRAPPAGRAEGGERRIERASQRRFWPEAGVDNPALHEALRRRFGSPLPAAALDAHGDEGRDDGGEARAPAEAGEVGQGMKMYRSGWRLLRQGRPEDARERFESVLAMVPNDYLTLLNIGIAHQRLQDTSAAEHAWQRALETDGETSLARLRLAESYAMAGRIDEAIALLESDAAPNAPAGTREAIGDLFDELTARQHDEEAQPGRPPAAEDPRLRDALAHIVDGSHDRARTILQGILDEQPDDALARLNMGVVHQNQGRLAEAETEFQRLLDSDPRNLNAALRLGMVYAASRRTDLAIRLLHRVASEGAGQETGSRAAAELERLERQRLGSLIGTVIRPDPVEWTLQARFFHTDTSLPGVSLTESYSHGVGISLASTSVRRGDWLLDYTWGTRRNEHPLGTDYAYDWHEAGLTYRTRVPNARRLFGSAENIPGLTGMLALTWHGRRYREADTNALHVLEEARRRSFRSLTFTAGLNYQVPRYEKLGYFLTWTRSRSRTNLPIGLVHDPDGEPIAFQSSGLGAFDSNFITLGLNFRF